MYGPNLSATASVSIRRLAWAMHTNMGQAVDAMVRLISGHIDQKKICSACKDDSKCTACIFTAGIKPALRLPELLK